MDSIVWDEIMDCIDANRNKKVLTNWMTLSDPKEREEFEKFGASRVSATTVFLVCLLFLLKYSYELSLNLSYIDKLFNRIYPLLTVSVSAGLVFIPSCCSLWYAKKHRKDAAKSSFLTFLVKRISCMESCLAISSVTSVGLKAIIRVTNGACVNDMQHHVWLCNVGHDSRMLMDDTSLLLMMLPIIFKVIFKTSRFEVICLSWLISTVCMATSIALSEATNSLPVFVIYIPFSIIILWEIQRQDLNLFFLVKQQTTLLAENKQMAEDQQTELRHMIANVAHDLKTVSALFWSPMLVIFTWLSPMFLSTQPLSALTNGFETITFLAEQSMATSPTGSVIYTTEGLVNAADAAASTACMRETVRNLTNVTSFMIMTINRCIDFTKASKGFKLVSKLETINLAEILALPINCMKDLQSRITIDLLPLPTEICSHIITDKQWLQENLFCLISNAVKYSTGGSITIGVSEIDTRRPMIKQFVSATEAQSNAHKHQCCYSADNSTSPVTGHCGPDYSYLDVLEQNSTSSHVHALKKTSTESNLFTGIKAAVVTTTEPEIENNRFKFMGGLTKSSKVYSCSSDDCCTPTEENAFRNASKKRPLLLFEVEDTGIGLSDEIMATLFTPFKQAQRRAGGTGLGLYSLAKRLEALGGCYGVQRRKDGKEGSLFWFAIPYTPDTSMLTTDDDPTENDNKPQQTGLVKGTGDHAIMSPYPSDRVGTFPRVPTQETLAASPDNLPCPLNILLADDSVPILKMTSMLLKRQKHTVTQAENGAEALKIIAERKAMVDDTGVPLPPFDVVLMDLNMPVMDGLEATTRIRAQEAANSNTTEQNISEARQFIVGLSANSDHQTMMEAYESGVDDYMCKPFSLQAFHDCYQKHIGK